MSNHSSHKTRYSDSSIYDEICIYCGATDARGCNDLGHPCPNAPKEKVVDKQQQAFVDLLDKEPTDWTTRLVYADWLDEHDQPEEADRMRRWRASREWMTNWVRSINYNRYEEDPDTGDYLIDVYGNRILSEEDNLGNPHTYENAIEAGYDACQGLGYCWGTDAGKDYFFTEDYESVRTDRVVEWFYHWSTLTGVSVPNLDQMVKHPPFRCAC